MYNDTMSAQGEIGRASKFNWKLDRLLDYIDVTFASTGQHIKSFAAGTHQAQETTFLLNQRLMSLVKDYLTELAPGDRDPCNTVLFLSALQEQVANLKKVFEAAALIT